MGDEQYLYDIAGACGRQEIQPKPYIYDCGRVFRWKALINYPQELLAALGVTYSGIERSEVAARRFFL